MNQKMDTKEFLKLQETEQGYDLYINDKPIKLEFKSGKLLNELTKKQMNFVKDFI